MNFFRVFLNSLIICTAILCISCEIDNSVGGGSDADVPKDMGTPLIAAETYGTSQKITFKSDTTKIESTLITTNFRYPPGQIVLFQSLSFFLD